MKLQDKHIFLSGFMGAGKSRIGPHLAGLLQRPFFDTDQVIEQRANKSISRIFKEDGEDDFRAMEKITISELCNAEQKSVVALGGGAVIREEIRVLLHQHGVVIYLQSDPAEIIKRVRKVEKRPLLQNASGSQELLERLNALLEVRRPNYERADIIFNRDGLEAEVVAEKLQQMLEGDA